MYNIYIILNLGKDINMLSKVILPKHSSKSHYFPYIKSKQTFKLSNGITAIIGPNASGKTTFLNTVKNIDTEDDVLTNKKYNSIIFSPSEYSYTPKVVFDDITLRKINIITYNPSKYSKNADSNAAINSLSLDTFMSVHIFSQSNAQCAAFYFEDFFNTYKDIMKSENCIILVDEPETSNDIKNIVYLMLAFKNWTMHCPNLQILIATHHPAVLKHADQIIEMKLGYKEELINDWKQLLNSFS